MRHEIAQPLLAILLLMPLSVSAGELDGKFLICEKTKNNDELDLGRIKGIRFESDEFNNGRAYLDVLSVTDESIEINPANSYGTVYATTLEEVLISNWVIDRTTLMLTYEIRDTLTNEPKFKPKSFEFQCKLARDSDHYRQMLGERREQLQTEFDAKLSARKI
jgi:hypothetical protein